MAFARQSVEALYEVFGLTPGCPENELRRAYRREIIATHPDKNPGNVEAATKRTQEINAAYDLLKKHRENPDSLFTQEDSDIQEGIGFTFTVDFISQVDLRDIAQRKDAFRRAVDAFQKTPYDTIQALRMIHASFLAERYMEFQALLEDSLLIDSSAILLQLMEKDEAVETILRWADYLDDKGKTEKGVQILEDAFTEGARGESIREKLRSYHYIVAQGYHLGGKKKPAPPDRIAHLSRILELGFELDYVHKLLAEAYYENGDSASALKHLKRAKEINPDFKGAVKVSRALGLLPQREKRKQTRQHHKYTFTNPGQIPHATQIRSWASEGKWEQIFSFADLAYYSPQIIPSSRSTIRQIAASLGDCPDEKALELLRALQPSVYWDVREAVQSSLVRWGKGSMPQVYTKSDNNEAPDIVRRLWDMLVFETYHPGNDDYYLTALTQLCNQILNSIAPDDILGALRDMTRWLELIGERQMTHWIRDLIRREAPGTWYVDADRGDNYIQNVKISEKLLTNLAPLLEKIRLDAPNKLAQALGSQSALGGGKIKGKTKALPD